MLERGTSQRVRSQNAYDTPMPDPNLELLEAAARLLEPMLDGFTNRWYGPAMDALPGFMPEDEARLAVLRERLDAAASGA